MEHFRHSRKCPLVPSSPLASHPQDNQSSKGFFDLISSSCYKGPLIPGGSQPRGLSPPTRTGQRREGSDPWRHLQTTDAPCGWRGLTCFITARVRSSMSFCYWYQKASWSIVYSQCVLKSGELILILSQIFPKECSRSFHLKGEWFVNDRYPVVFRKHNAPQHLSIKQSNVLPKMLQQLKILSWEDRFLRLFAELTGSLDLGPGSILPTELWQGCGRKSKNYTFIWSSGVTTQMRPRQTGRGWGI